MTDKELRAKTVAKRIANDLSLKIEQNKFRMRELRHQIMFESQAETARQIAESMADPIEARIRELDRMNRIYRACLEEPETEHVERGSRGGARVTVSSEGEWYLSDYAKRLNGAMERERRRTPVVGRRTVIREWLELYRASGMTAGLREIVRATREWEAS